MPLKLAMLADDLTGACDAGVQFAARGISTVVWLAPEAGESAEMVVLSTESRNDAPEEARRKVCEACRRLLAEGRQVAFKKIDSTLYGNVVEEVEAALEVCGFQEALLAPAFPLMGRTVVDGWLQVPGSDRRVNLAALAAGHPAIRIFDTVSQEDLARVALLAGETALLVGSAGLAREAATLRAAQAGEQRWERKRGPVLFVIGSTNPVTTAQVRYLRAHRPESRLVSSPDELGNARGLVLSGGDTAALACRALGVRAIRLHREILPGIPCGTLVGGRADGLAVATKAGGFGPEDALAVIADSL